MCIKSEREFNSWLVLVAPEFSLSQSCFCEGLHVGVAKSMNSLFPPKREFLACVVMQNIFLTLAERWY